MAEQPVKVRKVPDSDRELDSGAELGLTTLLVDGAKLMGFDLTEECTSQLMAYLKLLIKWNRVYNLTSIRQAESMVIYHLLDSLSIAGFIKGTSLLDVGTGAGLPGIPLAILNPDLRVTLLDSNGKKVRFVTQVCIDLGLTNVKPVQSRIESYQEDSAQRLGAKGDGAGFDNIVSRAFSDLATFRQLTNHLVAEGGQRLAMRGRIENVATDGKKNGIRTFPIDLPFVEDKRHVQIF